MQKHPLTPMRDADIRRVLAEQSTVPVGHVAASTVLSGAEAIRSALDAESAAGKRLIVVDAMRDQDLLEIGYASKGLPLLPVQVLLWGCPITLKSQRKTIRSGRVSPASVLL